MFRVIPPAVDGIQGFELTECHGFSIRVVKRFMADIAWNGCYKLRHLGCHVAICIRVQSGLSRAKDHDFMLIHVTQGAFRQWGGHLVQGDPSVIHHHPGQIPVPKHPLGSNLRCESSVCIEISGVACFVDCY